MAYIYAPTTGDRVFACDTTRGGLVVVRYRNGSRHVLGSGVEVSAHCSSPGHWCRTDARRAVSQIVSRYGGIGWDAQGTVHVLVPPHAAGLARAALAAVLEAAGDRQQAEKLRFAGWLLAVHQGSDPREESPMGSVCAAEQGREALTQTVPFMEGTYRIAEFEGRRTVTVEHPAWGVAVATTPADSAWEVVSVEGATKAPEEMVQDYAQ